MDQDYSTATEISYGTQSQMCLNINEVHNFQAFFSAQSMFLVARYHISTNNLTQI